jgi:hypothetical protein
MYLREGIVVTNLSLPSCYLKVDKHVDSLPGIRIFYPWED